MARSKPIGKMTRQSKSVVTHDRGASLYATDVGAPEWWVEVRVDGRGRLYATGSDFAGRKLIPEHGWEDPDKKVWVTR